MARPSTSSGLKPFSYPTILSRFVGVAMMIILATSLSPRGAAGSVVAENAADAAELISNVSGERLMSSIRALQDFGSRAFYLNTSLEAADYLRDELSGLGLYVRLDEFSAGNHSVANVVATKNGTSLSAARVLVGAHYDSENMDAEDFVLGSQLAAPGADDDASGVAAVLELARILSNQQLDRTVQFVMFAAEENGYDHSGGLAGSRHFVLEEKARGTSYKATAILDMIGYRGTNENHVVAVVNEEESDLVNSIRNGIDTHDVNLTFAVVTDPMARYSDHYSFWTAGYPSILLIEADWSLADFAYSPYYHSAGDTVDTLSEEQVTEVTKALLGGILGLVELRDRANTLLIVIVISGIASVAVSAVYLYHRNRKVGEA